MGIGRKAAVAVAILTFAACGRSASDATPPHPLDIALAHGSVAVVVQLDVANRGSAGSPAWDPADIAAAQERIIDRVGAHAEVTSRPSDVPNLGLRLGPRGIRRLDRGLGFVGGYYVDEGREPNLE